MKNSMIFIVIPIYNEVSIKDLATLLTEKFKQHPLRVQFPPLAGTHTVESRAFYGDGYLDVQHGRPSINLADKLLDCAPDLPFADSIEKNSRFFSQRGQGAGNK